MVMEKDCFSKSGFHRCLPRQRSFRDMHSAISKMDPQLVKSVITSGSSGNYQSHSKMAFSSVPSSPDKEGKEKILFPSSSSAIYPPIPRTAEENTAPLTIFYKGTVAVFQVPGDKAETILKLAEKGVPKAVGRADPNAAVAAASMSDQRQLLLTLEGDLPIARRKSLQRFLEKRKERLTLVPPYGCSHTKCAVLDRTRRA